MKVWKGLRGKFGVGDMLAIARSVAEQAPERFLDAYVECALWSSTDNDAGGKPLDGRQIDPATLATMRAEMRAECNAFLEENIADIVSWRGKPENVLCAVENAGHDFWLTRNRHGAGFWDGDWSKDAGKRLTDAAHAYGGVDLYVGHDGKVHA